MLKPILMTSRNHLTEFLSSIEHALKEGVFIKISLGHYTGSEEGLKQIIARKTLVKRQEKISFTYRYKTRDIVKNFESEEAFRKIQSALATGFCVVTLFTEEQDLTFEQVEGRKVILRRGSPTHGGQSVSHDRVKKRLISSEGKFYLTALGITDNSGQVLKASQDKYRQINKFVEVISGLIKDLPPENLSRVLDMGSGKGYLTFALADYLANTLNLKTRVTGIEMRPDMVALCNSIAQESGFSTLDFKEGTIASCDAEGTNVLIALHACDTATDDAIAKGIHAGADLIVVAPCCHKQIRREMEAGKKKSDLAFLLEHGVFMERQAEMVTDGLRSLILEYSGYTTKVFEFISDAHTPKNVMIVATKNNKPRDPAILTKIEAAKTYFGISRHHLETVLTM